MLSKVGKVKSFTPADLKNIQTAYEAREPKSDEERQLRSLVGKSLTPKQYARHAAIGIGSGLGVHFAQPIIGGGRRWTPWVGKKEIADVIAGKDWPEQTRQEAEKILSKVKTRSSTGRIGDFLKGGRVSPGVVKEIAKLLPEKSPVHRALYQSSLEASRAILHPRQLAVAATIGTILSLAVPAAKQVADTHAAKKGKF